MFEDKAVSHFEYVFYFLLRTYVPSADGRCWEEPALGLETTQRTVSQHGVCFEDDKRLFRRDAQPGEPLANWANCLIRNWQSVCRVYAKAFGTEKQAQAYCHRALIGVTLFILEDGDTLDYHIVKVDMAAPKTQLHFVPSISEQPLFRIQLEGFNKTAYFYHFKPITSENQPFRGNLQLDLKNSPHLVPLDTGEFASNPIFGVYGFSYGGDVKEWKDGVTRLLIRRGTLNRTSLLSTLFTRLIMAQWQFECIDETAQNLRIRLQSQNNIYHHYAKNYGNAHINCTGTHRLENQLQKMNRLHSETIQMFNRLQRALQTLEMNAENLAKRLEQIRQETEQVNWQIEFHLGANKQVQWPQFHNEIPLLAIFNANIQKLHEHSVYLEQQLNHLNSLREIWRLYLETKRTRLSEYLILLIIVLIFLLIGIGGMMTLNLYPKMPLPIIPYQQLDVILTMLVLIPGILILGYLIIQIMRWFYCLGKRIYVFFLNHLFKE
jgi:hypothetical protein